MERRIAVVQFGDYREGLRLIDAGAPEPCFGLFYAVGVVRDLVAPHPHLVVSLGAAERYREEVGQGRLVGVPFPHPPRWLRLPGAGLAADRLWSNRVLAELREFAPTHILLRAGGSVGNRTLAYGISRSANIAAVYAGSFGCPGLLFRLSIRRMVRLLNRDEVVLVANHRAPATRTMIEHGVRADKTIAYDWPGARTPAAYPAKALRPAEPVRIVYVGAVLRDKGVGDAIDATGLLLRRRLKAELTVVGDGPDMPAMRAAAAALPAGAVRFTGRVSNDEAFDRMRSASVVCVPSRPEFPEGLPKTLTEALAARTPVVASDHPMHVGAFRDGEGVAFFRAADPQSLADRLAVVGTCPETYRRLSESTPAAFARVDCPTTFGDVIERWKATF